MTLDSMVVHLDTIGVKLVSVAVLLSTYNGERYLAELLDSLVAQEGVDVHIFVRDDGSTDGTLKILASYEDRIDYVDSTGPNLGPALSFLKLVRDVPGFDYYAYCDQDDVWYPSKLFQATKMMEDVEEGKPALYMSTYDVVNEDLDYLSTFDMKFERPLTLGETIVYRSPSGCTMVFNQKLRDLVAISNPDFVRMHDFWTLLVAETFHAKLITDSTPLLGYRQHSDNTVGIIPSPYMRFKRLFKSALHGNNERWRQAHNLLAFYSDTMPEDSKATINKVDEYRRSLKNRFGLAFDEHYNVGDLRTDFLFKVSVLTGLF